MNLFILHKKSWITATWHCDKHCVKMIVETCQMLYTAWWCNKYMENIEWYPCNFEPYKLSHINHPVSIWIRENKKHYIWALQVALHLCNEYNRRYNKVHKCIHHLKRLYMMGYPISNQKFINKTVNERKIARKGCPMESEYFYCAIPDDVFDECAVYEEDHLNAMLTYRNYYRLKKFDMKWNKGKDPIPYWY